MQAFCYHIAKLVPCFHPCIHTKFSFINQVFISVAIFLWCVIGDMSSISGSEDSSDDEEEEEEEEDTKSAGIYVLINLHHPSCQCEVTVWLHLDVIIQSTQTSIFRYKSPRSKATGSPLLPEC